MALEKIQSTEKCKAKGRIETLGDRHFYRVYLWETKEDMHREILEDCGACHRPMPYLENATTGELYVPPMLGDFHFYSGGWDEEVVSHECAHAMFYYAYTHNLENDDMSTEEVLCYFLGDLFKKVYRWVWTADKDS